MMMSLKLVRLTSRCVCLQQSIALPNKTFFRNYKCRSFSTEAVANKEVLPPPPLDGEKIYEPKIVQLVDSISNLTLREVSDLNELLKKSLNIKEVTVAAPVATAGPVQEEKVADEAEKVPEKEEFVVKLVGFAAADKIKLIKALKVIKPSLNLVQAKKFVESAPQVLLEGASKEECEEVKKALEEAGGKVEII